MSDCAFHGTLLVSCDLSSARLIERTRHFGPSEVSISTIELSQGRIPRDFLIGCGFQDWEIECAKLYDQSLSAADIVDSQYEVIRLRAGSWRTQNTRSLDAFRATRATLYGLLGQHAQPRYLSCFISYSHADAAFATRLHDELQARDIRCWRDEKSMKPGDRILDAVHEAVRSHDRIILCCSSASLTSSWVKDEIRKAQARERKENRDIIIPLNLDDFLLHDWNDGLASDIVSRLAANFTGWEDNDARFEEQLERVVQALRKQDAD